ncbi:MAG: ABC transporter permease [Planctomycetota bacterium]|nr:ABC transporter permease [Planctomycetota bacterium]
MTRAAVDSYPGARHRARWPAPALVGILVLLIVAGACILSLPWTLARVDDGEGMAVRRFESTSYSQALLPPAWWGGGAAGGWMGTDRYGRDVLARCLLGGAVSLTVGLSAAAIAVVIGTLYGAIAGARRGLVDGIMMRFVDLLYGIPGLLLVVLLAVAVDGASARLGLEKTPALARIIDVAVLVVAIGGMSWLTMARVVRGQVLSLRERPFMEATRALGLSPARQFFRHVLPNLVGPVAVYAALAVPSAILSESFLSFLGIGIREPLPSWGSLASAGLTELNVVTARWWLLVWPCALIAVTLVALGLVGDGLRDALDPTSAARRSA